VLLTNLSGSGSSAMDEKGRDDLCLEATLLQGHAAIETTTRMVGWTTDDAEDRFKSDGTKDESYVGRGEVQPTAAEATFQ
jgi:hypothetical protein